MGAWESGDPEDRLDPDTRVAMALVLMLGLGVFMWGRAVWTGVTSWRLERGYAESRGAIVDCNRELGRNAHGVHVKLRYVVPQAGTEDVEAHSSAENCDVAHQNSYSVRFLLDDPDVAMTTEEYAAASAMVRNMFIGGTFPLVIAIGGFLWRQRRYRGRARVPDDDTLRDTPGSSGG